MLYKIKSTFLSLFHIFLLSHSCSLFQSFLSIYLEHRIQFSHINLACSALNTGSYNMPLCFFIFCPRSPRVAGIISYPIHLSSIHHPSPRLRVSFSMKPFLVPFLPLCTIYSREFYYTYMSMCLFFPTRW